MHKFKTALLFCFLSLSVQASDSLNTSEVSDEVYEMMYRHFMDSVEQTLKFETGNISIKYGLATISVPDGFKYLNGADSEMILTDIWGNPPSDPGEQSLGMLVPSDRKMLGDSTYCINITYSDEGFIKDEDASDIDYDELLEGMQSDSEEYNVYRVENGYETIELVGWASPPYYDAEKKKLHWAKELKFGETEINTLNYNIRILGRKGYLELNAISDINMLGVVKDNINPILDNVNFNDGNTYADFDPDIDKVAAYGIGGLIAGKVLLKAGILAKLGILLAKFWKIIAIAVLAFGAGIKNIFKKKEPFNTVQPKDKEDEAEEE